MPQRPGRKRRDALFRMAVYASAAYVLIVLSSFPASMLLPTFKEVASHRDTSCYMTNALIVFAECGNAVKAGAWISTYFNAWILALYGPILAMRSVKVFGLALLGYAPAAFLLFAFVRCIRRSRS